LTCRFVTRVARIMPRVVLRLICVMFCAILAHVSTG
jgi:hypothetical protein